MINTLLLETILGQTRLAVIEDGRLREIHIERPGGENLVGNIYLGRVENVLPGMNAAFVDIGIGKNAFLSAADAQMKADRSERIEEMVCPGQEILVQVTKATTGDKGPRVSRNISLAGRTIVLMPRQDQIGISRKLTDEPERLRLINIVRQKLSGTGMGAIVRTAAAGLPREALAGELDGLIAHWEDLRHRADHSIAPRRLHCEESLMLQAVRDMLNEETDALWTDNPGAYGTLRTLAATLAPAWQDRIQLHRGEVPLFDLYRVDAQIDQALRKRVWLKSGGFLIIEETEALTVIDVNTGKFTGSRALEDTIVCINLEAAEEIMRQLRLRDIGGIVVVDFIDMAEATHREALLARLRECATRDRNRTRVAGLTSLGLVELTRKRARQPLSSQLFHPCEACDGSGWEPTYETTARRALREVWRRRWMGEENPILIEAGQPVLDWLTGIGAPAGGDVYAAKNGALKVSEYTLSPAQPGSLPDGARLLKRG